MRRFGTPYRGMPVTFRAGDQARFRGQGLGLELLRWVEEYVASSGKRFLRLDCRADNRKPNEDYERAGFRRCGRAWVWDFEVSLYEKRDGIVSAG
jgi:GNAT superfamily N-acetyltransferase